MAGTILIEAHTGAWALAYKSQILIFEYQNEGYRDSRDPKDHQLI